GRNGGFMKNLLKNSQGMALVVVTLLMSIFLTLTGAGLLFSQLDLKMAGNHKLGTEAFHIADAGIVRGKEWLDGNLTSGPFPTTIADSFGSGSYTVIVDRFTPGTNDGTYRITSTGLRLNDTKKAIESVVKRPSFNPPAVITIDGDGTHSDFDDGSGGTGSRIPAFSIDGRDHSADGSSLAPTGIALSAFAGTELGINTDITSSASDLKKRIVKRANAFCPGADCTPGLYYVKDMNLTDNDGDCLGPQCYENLGLSDPGLRATARDGTTSPPTYTFPSSPDDAGPFTPISGSSPLVKNLNSTEISELQQSIQDIIELSNASPASKKNCISNDIIGGTYTFGTPSDPMVTFIGDPCSSNPTYVPGGNGNDLDVRNGAVVSGAGILIVPRRLRLRDATFNWQGIVLVVEDGDFRVGQGGGGGSENSCGSINGAIILQDDAGNDPKLDMDKVAPGSATCESFSVNFSSEAVNNTLDLLEVVSWKEMF
ncbi:MAG: hypothetical protein ACE5E2_05365, partial [Candidatus Binatia bacterium]